jgi:hypothetical protein
VKKISRLRPNWKGRNGRPSCVIKACEKNTSVLFPKITVRATPDFDSLLLPSFLVATTVQQRGGQDQTPYPASPPHHEPSSLWPSSIIAVDHRASCRSAPPAHGRKERNVVQRPDDQRASPPGPPHQGRSPVEAKLGSGPCLPADSRSPLALASTYAVRC